MVDVVENNHAICYIVQEQDFLACRPLYIYSEHRHGRFTPYVGMYVAEAAHVIARFGEFSGVSAASLAAGWVVSLITIQ